MAGHLYQDGCWISQGDPALVNEQQTEVGVAAAAGAVRQFVAGQLGKTISLPDPTNSGALIPLTYKYIRRHEDSAEDLVPGTVLYWTNPCGGDYTVIEGDAQVEGVTPLVPAGVFLGDDAAAVGSQGVQPGNFGFIQIGGCADVLVEAAFGVTAGQEVMQTGSAPARGVETKSDPSQPRFGVALETVAADREADETARVLLDIVSLTVSQG
jgi:hypothetical protein